MNTQIKAKELRIGNVVNRINFGVYTITGIGSDGTVRTDKGVLPIMAIDGIPLTEAWLLKLGFESVQIYESVYQFTLCNERIHTDGSLFIYMGYHDGIEIKYIHQLQNLYFALTGEELTIKRRDGR